MMNLKHYVCRKWPVYTVALSSMVISVSLDMLSPQLIRHIIDDVVIGGKTALLFGLLAGILAVGIGRCVFQYTKEFLFDRTGAHIACQLRSDLMEWLQGLSANFFDKKNTGELMSRVKDDIDRIWDALTYIGMLSIEIVIHTCIVLYCMYSLNWKLSIIPSVCMVAAGAIAFFMEQKLGKVFEDIAQEDSVLNNTAAENLAGMRTVKAFAREQFEIGKFKGHNTRYFRLNIQQSRIYVKYYPFLQAITRLLPFLVLLPGGYMVMKQHLTLGELTAFIQYSMNIVWPMEMLGWLTNGISAARASAKRINLLYEEVPQIKEIPHPVILPQIKGAVRFDHVDFQADNGTAILKDISFSLSPGKTIGIMGATGSGKTTVINLLKRMYDVTAGAIYIEETDIRQLSLQQLRSSVACVMQDIFLFSDTVGDNVKLGRRNRLSEGDVHNALTAAQADDFVQRMENRYDTVIGERGVGLSGGQKQRLTIARALSCKAPILVFDDSTSALDAETEQRIQETLDETAGCTKILIAHRISAVRKADEIIVLDQGHIAERGTHDQLLALKGIYYKTYKTQYGFSGEAAENGI